MFERLPRLLAAPLALLLIVVSLTPAPAGAQAPMVKDATTVDEVRSASDYNPATDPQVLRLYRAFFNREPDAQGARYWIEIRKTRSLIEIAEYFTLQKEFENNYSGTDDREFLTRVYLNVLGRDYDEGGFIYWLDTLRGTNESNNNPENKKISRGEVVRWVSESAEFTAKYPYAPIAPAASATGPDEIGPDRLTGDAVTLKAAGGWLATESGVYESAVALSSTNQAVARWERIDAGNGAIRLRNIGSHEFLSLVSPNLSTSDEAGIGLSRVADDRINWTVESVPGGVVLRNGNSYLNATADGASAGVTKAAATVFTINVVETDRAGCVAGDGTFAITSHADDETVDVSEDGSGTGTFVLSGTAPFGTDSIEVAGVEAGVQSSTEAERCMITWSVEVAPANSGRQTLTASAGQASDAVSLNLITPDSTDTLISPAFFEAPNVDSVITSYDDATGTFVLAGNLTDEVRAGHVLFGNPSATAPQGYLRIVVSTKVNARGNTVVTTTAGDLLDIVRQADIDQSYAVGETELADLNPAPGTRPAARALAPIELGVKIESPNKAFKLNGTITTQIETTFVLKVGWDWWSMLPTLESFIVGATNDWEGDLRLGFTLPAEETPKEQSGAKEERGKVFRPGPNIPIGIGPVSMEFGLIIDPFVTHELGASVEIPVAATGGSQTFGYRYNRNADNNGFYRTRTAPSIVSSTSAATFSIDASVEIGIKMGIEGGFLKTAGEAAAAAAGSDGPGGIKVVEIGVQASLKGELDIDFSLTGYIVNYDYSISLSVASYGEIGLTVMSKELVTYEVNKPILGPTPLWEKQVDPKIHTLSIPARLDTEPYNFRLEGLAQGGGTWTATAIPAGLRLSSVGRLTGTPTDPSDSSITVKLTGSNGKSVTRTFSLRSRRLVNTTGEWAAAELEQNVEDAKASPDGRFVAFIAPRPMEGEEAEALHLVVRKLFSSDREDDALVTPWHDGGQFWWGTNSELRHTVLLEDTLLGDWLQISIYNPQSGTSTVQVPDKAFLKVSPLSSELANVTAADVPAEGGAPGLAAPTTVGTFQVSNGTIDSRYGDRIKFSSPRGGSVIIEKEVGIGGFIQTFPFHEDDWGSSRLPQNLDEVVGMTTTPHIYTLDSIDRTFRAWYPEGDSPPDIAVEVENVESSAISTHGNVAGLVVRDSSGERKLAFASTGFEEFGGFDTAPTNVTFGRPVDKLSVSGRAGTSTAVAVIEGRLYGIVRIVQPPDQIN